jgi:hypothetical protein
MPVWAAMCRDDGLARGLRPATATARGDAVDDSGQTIEQIAKTVFPFIL